MTGKSSNRSSWRTSEAGPSDSEDFEKRKSPEVVEFKLSPEPPLVRKNTGDFSKP
jgi:hypothetical protein